MAVSPLRQDESDNENILGASVLYRIEIFQTSPAIHSEKNRKSVSCGGVFVWKVEIFVINFPNPGCLGFSALIKKTCSLNPRGSAYKSIVEEFPIVSSRIHELSLVCLQKLTSQHASTFKYFFKGCIK